MFKTALLFVFLVSSCNCKVVLSEEAISDKYGNNQDSIGEFYSIVPVRSGIPKKEFIHNEEKISINNGVIVNVNYKELNKNIFTQQQNHLPINSKPPVEKVNHKKENITNEQNLAHEISGEINNDIFSDLSPPTTKRPNEKMVRPNERKTLVNKEQSMNEIDSDVSSVHNGHINLTSKIFKDNIGYNQEKISPSIEVLENNKGLNNDIFSGLPINSIVTSKTPVENTKAKVKKVNNGTALILTHFIENGQFDTARNACKVDPTLFLGVKSYSGFFTVNKTYDSNVFFWYFPVEDKLVSDSPLIIWLQGGPGASSLTGLFKEIGPFSVNRVGMLKRNPYSWLHNHSLLFIDNPIGSGYSFTNSDEGFVSDMSTYSEHLFSTVQQFLKVFPELRKVPLYVAGESYAGKYVPALGLILHKNKNIPGNEVNLKGFMIGNAYVDPAMIANVTDLYHYLGLLDQHQLDMVNPLVESFHRAIDANNSIEAKEKWHILIYVLLTLTQQPQGYNFLKNEIQIDQFSKFLESSKVKRAIHVGDINFSFINVTTNAKMAPDFLSSTKGIFETLLEHYRVLTYCGHLDLMLSCIATGKNHRTWEWSNSTKFREANRNPFTYYGDLVGYHKSGGGLTEVMIRGAGHMVPLDKPATALMMITRWIREEPISTPSPFWNLISQELIRNNSPVYF